MGFSCTNHPAMGELNGGTPMAMEAPICSAQAARMRSPTEAPKQNPPKYPAGSKKAKKALSHAAHNILQLLNSCIFF